MMNSWNCQFILIFDVFFIFVIFVNVVASKSKSKNPTQRMNHDESTNKK